MMCGNVVVRSGGCFVASKQRVSRAALNASQPATATQPNQPIIKAKRAASLGPLSRDGCVVGRGRQRLLPPPRCWKIDQRRPPQRERSAGRRSFLLGARDLLFFSLAAHLSPATNARILQLHSRTQTHQTKKCKFWKHAPANVLTLMVY